MSQFFFYDFASNVHVYVDHSNPSAHWTGRSETLTRARARMCVCVRVCVCRVGGGGGWGRGGMLLTFPDMV